MPRLRRVKLRLRDASFARFVQKQNRRWSGGSAVVIVEHPTEALSPLHRVRLFNDGAGLHESVCETLMIVLSMVLRHEVGVRMLKRGMSEEDHSVQTLGFY